MSRVTGYPWQNATASLKREWVRCRVQEKRGLSVAKRHGLIEASAVSSLSAYWFTLSVAKRHGLIEAQGIGIVLGFDAWLSVAKRHGLIEACLTRRIPAYAQRYPWQNATASLKHAGRLVCIECLSQLSVAKRHGLIEASRRTRYDYYWPGYPWQNATASLKHPVDQVTPFLEKGYPWQNATASLKRLRQRGVT